MASLHAVGTGMHAEGRPRGFPAALAIPVVSNFSAALCVVAPFLGLREIGVAIGQWRDLTTAATHPSVPARIVSAEATGGARHPEAASTVVLAFQPAPAVACEVPVHVGFSATRFPAGQTVMVVPKSAYCEPPILRSEIGDPLGTVGLAGALFIGAFGAFRLWTVLQRGPARRPPARTRFRPSVVSKIR